MTVMQIDAKRSARRPLGVGIVGLSAAGGWAARAHLPALAQVDGMELRGLAASSQASADAASALYGVPGHGSVDALARAGDIDLVVVAVKVARHRELVLPALRAGLPVLSEWPFGLNGDEAGEMALAAEGRRGFIGLQGRSSPWARWLADLVSGGYVGQLLSATVLMSSAEWGGPVTERMRYTLDQDAGATMLAIAFGHTIDLVSMVVGELDDVMATLATRRTHVPLAGSAALVPMTAHDQIAISGRLQGGAVLSVHHRGGTASGPGFSLVIDGTEGSLHITSQGYPHLGPVRVRGARGRAALADLPLPPGYDRYPQLAGTAIHTLAHAYAMIRDDLVNGTHAAPDFAHAVARHRLLDAIMHSAATGQRVRIQRP